MSSWLPGDLPVPRLLGVYDDGDWIALILEDIQGRPAATPWHVDELHAALRAFRYLATRLTPSPLPYLPPARDVLGADLEGWSRVALDPPANLDTWAACHLDQLVTLGKRGIDALSGHTMAHADVRADNLVVRPDGTIVVVDWSWACLGPFWLDSIGLLVNVNLHGGHDVDALVRDSVGTLVDPCDITGFLAGLAGYFVDVARQPAPAGLPTVRALQRAQGRSTLDWVRRRLGGSSC